MKKIKISHVLYVLAFMMFSSLNSDAQDKELLDSFCMHKTIWDTDNRLPAWYKPQVPGAAYSHVAKLAAEFLRDMPDEPEIGLPYYYLHQSSHRSAEIGKYAQKGAY